MKRRERIGVVVVVAAVFAGVSTRVGESQGGLQPSQVYISPYDPDRHVWVVERGGGRGVNMQILKFTNDGSKLVMRLVDPKHPTTRAAARANPRPGPFTYGDPVRRVERSVC